MSAKFWVLALASTALVSAPALAFAPTFAFAQAMPAAPVPYSQLATDDAKSAGKAEHNAHHMAHKAHHEAMKADDAASSAAAGGCWALLSLAPGCCSHRGFAGTRPTNSNMFRLAGP